jgi:hypothetical protein
MKTINAAAMYRSFSRMCSKNIRNNHQFYSIFVYMFKLLKAFAIITVIFGILYMGVSLYFIYYQKEVKEEVVNMSNAAIIELRDNVASVEQVIQDRVREALPYAEEERTLDSLKTVIDSIKNSVNLINNSPKTPEGFSAIVQLRKIFQEKNTGMVAIFAFLLVALIVLLLVSQNIGKKKKNVQKPIVNKPVATPSAPTLESTLEKFRSVAPLTVSTRNTITEPAPIVAPAPTQKAVESEQKSGNLVETVFDLSKKGYSVEEISEEAHIDQDQVRLILRFK